MPLQGKKASVPEWAQQIINEVAEQHGITVRPTIEWATIDTISSGGWAMSYQSGNKIRIRAGADPEKQKLTLLHELAHWLQDSRTGHSKEFWQKCFELYYQYGLSVHLVRAEFQYKELSKWAFNRSPYVVKDKQQAAMTVRLRNDCVCHCHWRPVEI